jgi:hypothetical protein
VHCRSLRQPGESRYLAAGADATEPDGLVLRHAVMPPVQR